MPKLLGKLDLVSERPEPTEEELVIHEVKEMLKPMSGTLKPFDALNIRRCKMI